MEVKIMFDAEKFVSATLLDGGATTHVHRDDTPRDGYMVSDPGQTFYPVRALTADVVATYVARHAAELADDNAYLGSWIDHGTVYLDVSRRYTQLATALIMGRVNHQKAIYDVANGEDVAVHSDDNAPEPTSYDAAANAA